VSHRADDVSHGAGLRRRAWLVAVLLAACRSQGDAPAATSAAHGAHSAEAVARFLRGDSLYKRDFDSARVVFDSAIIAARRDGDSVTLARALTSRANAAWRLGRYDEAKRIGDEALALKRRIHLDAELPKSYAGLGLLAQARGQLEEAQALFTRGLTASIAADDSAYVTRSHNNLGLVLTDLGEFDRARSELDAARATAAARGDGVVETSAAINLGRLELEIGDPTAALGWLRGARTRSAALGYFVGEENALGQMARAHAALGQPDLAIRYTDSALAIARAHRLKEPEADDLHQMAELYQSDGQYKPALRLLGEARAIADSLGMVTKLAHVSLAEAHAYAALGNLRVARGRATALVARLRREGARADELEAELYAAELAQRAGDRAGAEARLDTASSIAASLGTSLARVRVALARARVLDARAAADEVLPALASIRGDSLLLSADEQTERDALLARARLRLGEVDSAIVDGRRAVAGAERIRARLLTGELRAGYTSHRATVYADLVMALLRKGAVDEAFRVADAARGRSLTERLGAESRSLRAGRRPADAELRQLLARIELLTVRLRATDSARTRDRGPAYDTLAGALARKLGEARREYEALLVRAAPDEPAASILGTNTVGAAEVRRSLQAGEALIEFLSTSERLLTFVVTRDGVRWTESPVTDDDLAERVRSARDVIARRGPGGDAPLRGLYERLIAPLERSRMLAGAHTLVVVPHGALAYLPVAALVRDAPSGARYLVEDYSIVTLASASALPLLRGRTAARGAEQTSVLAPLPTELPATREEASAVVHASSSAHSWVGDAATERVLRDALARGGIVHVATHGVYEAPSPMFSGIRLATAHASAHVAPDDDGRLETHEVLAMSVRATLVFLSGCETALGPAWSTSFERSDDYVTLAQAFLFAGAQNVVATLWRIDDRSAAELAGRFSRALAGSSPAEALATAQRELIHGGTYRQPYYWAAYLVSGSGVIR
jgi:CHAT domain-containing protein/tetratricopeptide (TPR) repeat protein